MRESHEKISRRTRDERDGSGGDAVVGPGGIGEFLDERWVGVENGELGGPTHLQDKNDVVEGSVAASEGILREDH